MISIIINPIQYIVEKVDIILGNFHVIMGIFVIIKTEEYRCFLACERKIIKNRSERYNNMPAWMVKRSKATTVQVDKPTK